MSARQRSAGGMLALLLLACLPFGRTPKGMLAAPLPAWAQSGIAVQSDQAALDFPKTVRFTLKASSSAPIERVELIYRTNARSCLAATARQVVEFEKSANITAEWTWDLARSGALPPGAVITWQWQIRDAAGNSLTTPEKSLEVADDRYTWQSVRSGVVSVYWSKGDATFGKRVLDKAISSLAHLAAEAGLSAPAEVRLVVYPDSTQMRAASLHLPEWSGAVAISDYLTILLGLAPEDTSYLEEVVPHELAHLVTDQRIDNCTGSHLPTWLNEGLAVFSEGPTTESDRRRVLAALQSGALEPLLALAAGFPANSTRATLAYAQGGMVFTYLVQTYGRGKLSALLDRVQQGVVIDSALREVYGLDTAGVDQAFRASLGFGTPATGVPATSAAFTPTATLRRTAVPTLSLSTAQPTRAATSYADLSPTVPVPPTPAATPTPQPARTVTPTAPPPTAAPSPTPGAGGLESGPYIFIVAGAVILILAAVIVLILVRRSRQSP